MVSKTKEATMSPRKVSLRVAHQGNCPNATKTALSSIGRGSGCTCKPSFYTFQRDANGAPKKGPRVKDRGVADRMLTKDQHELDEGRGGVRRPKTITLHTWLDEFEKLTARRVQNGELKPRTLEAYTETNAHARKAIADIPLRDIGSAELREFDDRVSVTTAGTRTRATKPASRLRHLRQLSACLTSAVDESYLDSNPLRLYMKRLTKAGVRPPKRGKAPLEDAELERLWAALASYEPVYLHVCRFSAEAGLRLGELVALEWRNVSTDLSSVYVEHHWDEDAGLVAPKDREARRVFLTSHAQAVLEDWIGVVGEAVPEGPVFQNPLTGGRLTPRIAQRRLETAMQDAGIPKEHPELRLPRTFHSLRYTTSVLMQRRGFHPRLIEATLGHSSLELTYGVYGGWTPDQLAAEAGRDPSQA
jgi:integrase